MKKYFVYVLQNQTGLLYKGHTEDLQKRIQFHNMGKSTWTRAKGPWKLVYHEEFESRSEAIQREKFFKSGKGREFLRTIISQNTS